MKKSSEVFYASVTNGVTNRGPINSWRREIADVTVEISHRGDSTRDGEEKGEQLDFIGHEECVEFTLTRSTNRTAAKNYGYTFFSHLMRQFGWVS